MTKDEAMEKARVDLKFILADCHGDLDKAQARIDRALLDARESALEEIDMQIMERWREAPNDWQSGWARNDCTAGVLFAVGVIRSLKGREGEGRG